MSRHPAILATSSLLLPALLGSTLAACGGDPDGSDTAVTITFGGATSGIESTSEDSGDTTSFTGTSWSASDTNDTDETTTDDPDPDTDTKTDTDESDTDEPLDPALILFEEDFEAAAPDTIPAGWDTFIAWQAGGANNPGSDLFALVDDSRAHTGTQALHVKGGQNPAMLTRPLPPGTNRVFVRTYVWLTGQLGQNPGNNHETLIGVRGSVGQANEEVRFGEIKGVIGTNEVPSDDISPTMDQWGMGPLIAAGQWNCIEVAFVADEGPHRVEAWNNGEQVHLVDDPSQWNNMVLGDDFLTGKFAEFILGWHSFSSYDNEVWFDDLVVALERVGC